MILNFEIEQKSLGWFSDGIDIKNNKNGKIIGYYNGRKIYGLSCKTLQEFKTKFEERMRKQYSNFEWID